MPDAAEEVVAWAKELVTREDMAKHAPSVAQGHFPVRVDPAVLTPPRDAALGVWGQLTQRGLRQMLALGSDLNRRYRLSPSSSSSSSSSSSASSPLAGDGAGFLPEPPASLSSSPPTRPPPQLGDLVHCYSSHYSRTQQSAQAVLSGLYPDLWQSSSSSSSSENPEGGGHGEAGEDGSSISIKTTTTTTTAAAAASPVPIFVSRPDEERLNVFPHRPELYAKMQAAAATFEEKLVEADRLSVQRTRQRLVDGIPALAFQLRPMSWMSVLDVAECRDSRASSSADGRRAALRQADTVRELFAHIDADGDGTLTQEEVSEFLRRWFLCDLQDRDVAYIWDALSSFKDDGHEEEEAGNGAPQQMSGGGAMRSNNVDATAAAAEGRGGGRGGGEAGKDIVRVNQLRAMLEAEVAPLDVLSHANSSEIRRQVCKRFEHWYSDPSILALIVGPLAQFIGSYVEEAVEEAKRTTTATATTTTTTVATGAEHATTTTATGSSSIRTSRTDDHDHDAAVVPRLVMHSGHDITVVPLLRALGVWSADDGWPGYGCALRIELLHDDGGGAVAEGGEGEDTGGVGGSASGDGGGFFVRLWYHHGFRDADATNTSYEPSYRPLRLGQGTLTAGHGFGSELGEEEEGEDAPLAPLEQFLAAVRDVGGAE